MDAFDQLASMLGLRELLDLGWRLFGVNPALVSSDGQRVLIFERERRSQPFCAALERDPAGWTLCAMCDQSRFLQARRHALALRYRCHAGLTEFVVPVIREGEIVALLQCGQVHDRRPTPAEWRATRRSLVQAGINSGPLKRLFQRNRVLPPERQRDLLTFLELIANRLGNAHEQPVGAEPGRLQVQLGRAVTFIEAHLAERLTLPMVARAANVSTRSLARLFRKGIGNSVIQFVLRRRVLRACELLETTDRTCAEIAFGIGFGSVQHFNRIFRRLEEVSPRQWRRRALASASRVGVRSCAPVDERPV